MAVLLCGYSSSAVNGDKTQASKGGADFWVVKLDAGGNKLWDKVIGGTDGESIEVVHQTADGGFILGGYSTSNAGIDKTELSRGANDYWVVKVDSTWNKLWDKTIGGSAVDEFTDLIQTSDGGFLVGGYTNSPISGDKTQEIIGFTLTYDYWLLKLNATGNIIWDQILGHTKDDRLTSLFEAPDGGFMVGGYSESSPGIYKSSQTKGNYDYWIVKLGGSVTGQKEPASNFNIKITPNPNQGKFILEVQNLNSPSVQITLTDLAARVLWREEVKAADTYLSKEITLNKVKGIYLITIQTADRVITRKILID